MQTLTLRKLTPDDEAERIWMGKMLDDDAYDHLIEGDADVIDDLTGEHLMRFRKRVLRAEDCRAAYYSLRSAATHTDNRGMAAGEIPEDANEITRGGETVIIGDRSRTRYRQAKPDGTLSNTNRAKTVQSGIIGYFDRNPRIPFCRQTAFNIQHGDKFEAALPFIQQVSGHFKDLMPQRWAAQKAAVDETPSDFIIPRTVFSTITVNKNFQCVDHETECLTRRAGWITYKELRVGDEILAYDADANTTNWEMVTNMFVDEEYKGTMVRLKSRGFDSLTTADHRWPVHNRYLKTRKTCVSGNLPQSAYWSLLRGAPYVGGQEKYSDPFVRLLAWYMTEGNLTDDGYRISISQSQKTNPDKVESIRQDIAAIGARPESEWPLKCTDPNCEERAVCRGLCNKHACNQRHAEKKEGRFRALPGGGHGKRVRDGLWVSEYLRPDGINIFTLKGTEVSRILECVPGKDKVPSPEFIASLNARQAKIFVETCIIGDGYGAQKRFYQSHPVRMDAFSAAAALAGWFPTIDSSGQSCYSRQKSPHICLRETGRSAEYYEGAIWCPTVRTGFWTGELCFLSKRGDEGVRHGGGRTRPRQEPTTGG